MDRNEDVVVRDFCSLYSHHAHSIEGRDIDWTTRFDVTACLISLRSIGVAGAMLTRLECTETISCKKKVTKSWWRRIRPKWNGIIRWVIIFRETKHENRSRNFNKKIIFFCQFEQTKRNKKLKENEIWPDETNSGHARRPFVLESRT